MSVNRDNRVYTVSEVAAFFGVCGGTVYDWIYTDSIPVLKYTFELPKEIGAAPIHRYFFNGNDIYRVYDEGRVHFKGAVPVKNYPRRLARLKKKGF